MEQNIKKIIILNLIVLTIISGEILYGFNYLLNNQQDMQDEIDAFKEENQKIKYSIQTSSPPKRTKSSALGIQTTIHQFDEETMQLGRQINQFTIKIIDAVTKQPLQAEVTLRENMTAQLLSQQTDEFGLATFDLSVFPQKNTVTIHVRKSLFHEAQLTIEPGVSIQTIELFRQ